MAKVGLSTKSFTFHALLHRRSFCITYERPNDVTCYVLLEVVLHMKDLMMLLVMYCWKSRTLLFIHVAFMWEIFLDLHVNLLTDICCRFV